MSADQILAGTIKRTGVFYIINVYLISKIAPNTFTFTLKLFFDSIPSLISLRLLVCHTSNQGSIHRLKHKGMRT